MWKKILPALDRRGSLNGNGRSCDGGVVNGGVVQGRFAADDTVKTVRQGAAGLFGRLCDHAALLNKYNYVSTKLAWT